MRRLLPLFALTSVLPLALSLGACKNDEPEPEPEPEDMGKGKGEACDPEALAPDEDDAETGGEDEEILYCSGDLTCESVSGSGDYVCAVPYEIRGQVVDALDGTPIEGALVAALDETGAPVTNVVESDACGDYSLPVSVARTPEGEIDAALKWTLNVSAADYQPFPDGLRPALPIDTMDAVEDPDVPEEDEDEEEDEDPPARAQVIENAATHVALIPLEGDAAGGVTVSGTILEDSGAGALIVAEGGEGRRPHAIADASGAYTLFNVPSGDTTIRAYLRGLETDPLPLSVGGEGISDADLDVVSDIVEELAAVTGSLNIVNAPGGSMTSVVLVPSSVFNEALERGPVPLGLRAPQPPGEPNVTSDFEIAGVPSGTYKVLVAFENDLLVRDPDEGIAGTAIQEIDVSFGSPINVEESFKVTAALGIVGPGADAPELVEEAPTFIWMDDSSEDRYELVVYNALGELVWEDDAVPGVSGQETVELAYGGPALTSGMYYQFRVTSFKDQPNDSNAISRTEDLRGVFAFGESEPTPECDADGEDEGTGTGD